jgi:hypothetical protein
MPPARAAAATTRAALRSPPHGGGDLPHIDLDDALEILVLMAREKDPRFDRAGARWVGRLLAERPLELLDARYALVLVERLPDGVEPLRLRAARTRERRGTG